MGQLRDEALLSKVALKIKRLREQHQKSQDDIYIETNINVARIESAKSNISVSTLNALCKYFGMSLQEFFKGI